MDEIFRDLNRFFEISKLEPWGKLVAVKCTPNDLMDYREGDIPATIRDILYNNPNWKTEDSVDWAYQGSSNPEFYTFKVWELWNSIRRYGVKSPVHMHQNTGGTFRFHPSNNKIEVLTEYFPDLEITVLHHDYDFLRKYYYKEEFDWYLNLEHQVIESTEHYTSLFNLDADAELEFGWDYVKNICLAESDVWGKIKPVKFDWEEVDHQKHKDDDLYCTSLHLTCNDKYHRVKMEKQSKLLKDIIQARPGGFKFCGKTYSID